jgi:hypothetical protein
LKQRTDKTNRRYQVKKRNILEERTRDQNVIRELPCSPLSGHLLIPGVFLQPFLQTFFYLGEAKSGDFVVVIVTFPLAVVAPAADDPAFPTDFL